MTGVLEANTRTFASNWTGTGAIENSGNTERLALEAGENMESEDWQTGALSVTISLNVYAAGDAVTVQYKTAASQGDLAGASYNAYAGEFESLGWVKVKVISTL